VNQTVAPPLTLVSAAIRPPCASAMLRAIERSILHAFALRRRAGINGITDAIHTRLQ
jgi:hypothetical protein